jgi:hydrogenase nickel incorporation protein HypA/HybF
MNSTKRLLISLAINNDIFPIWLFPVIILSFAIMHELSITESLLEIALRHADSAGAKCISDLYLVIGELSSVVDESVQFYWDIIANETIAEGAKLHFQRVPTEILCLDCDTKYHPTNNQMACPNCDSIHVQILSGEEFFLEAINVEN